MNLSRIGREISRRALGLKLAASGRSHQFGEIFALRRFLAEFRVDALIDVGANEGQYARMARTDAGFRGPIFSFEPNPDVFAILERQAARDPAWHVFNMALSDHDGTVTFNIMAAHQFSSIAAPAERVDPIFAERNVVARTVETPCRRIDGLIDELLSSHRCRRPFLKMDTQGHDLAVCEGAGHRIKDFMGIQTELAVRPQYEGATGYRAMIDWLEQHGFVPNAFFANNKGHFPLLVEMDGIFVRSDLAAEGALSA